MRGRKRAVAKELGRAIRMLTTLHEVAMELAAARESEALPELIVQRATELVGGDGGGLYLYHPEERELELVVSHNLGRDMRGLRLKLGEGLAGRVIEEKRSLMINDYQRWEGRAQAYSNLPIGSSIAVPIHWQEEVIGTLNIHALRVKRRFVREDKELLELLAGHAAVAIGKAQKQQEIQRLHRRLLEISQEILASQDIEVILRRVACGIYEHSPFKLVAISLFERPIDPAGGERERIVQIMTAGLTPQEEEKLRGIAASGGSVPCQEILQKGKPLGGGYYVSPQLIPELVPKGVKGRVGRSGPDAWGPHDDFYFFLKGGERFIGRISLGDPVHGRVPTPEELEPLELFVNLVSLSLEKAYHLKKLSDFQRRLAGIYRLSERLARFDDLDPLIEEALKIIQENFNYEHVSLYLKEGDELVLRGLHTILASDESMKKFQSLSLERGIIGWVACNRQPALIGDISGDPRYIEVHPAIRSELAVPVVERETVLGALNIESIQRDAFSQEDLDLLQAVARQLSVALSDRRYHQQLHELAIHDPLTGLYNRHYLNEVLGREIVHTKRYHHPISLILTDFDDFHRVNDTLGHLVGDRILTEVAALIKGEIREADYLFRFGGDEFLILMPETNGQAECITKRLERALAHWNVKSTLGWSLGLSVGLSTWDPSSKRSFDEALAEADQQMYANKRIHHAQGCPA